MRNRSSISNHRAGQITRLLERWRTGEKEASEQLLSLIYDELRTLAAAQLRRERPGHTLETTALVHEAYLRLVDQRYVEWQNRAHFLALAARMMRRVLMNHARDRDSAKRGGRAPKLALDEALAQSVESPQDPVVLDEALTRLASVHPRQAKVVEMRFFGGMTSREIAEALGVSVPTVSRSWRMARAWLYRHITEEGER